MRRWTYWHSCMDTPPFAVPDLVECVDKARAVTRATFQRKVCPEALAALEARLGYSPARSGGLTMAEDYHVTYHTSRYRGRAVAFVRHSAIEYIFGPAESM